MGIGAAILAILAFVLGRYTKPTKREVRFLERPKVQAYEPPKQLKLRPTPSQEQLDRFPINPALRAFAEREHQHESDSSDTSSVDDFVRSLHDSEGD